MCSIPFFTDEQQKLANAPMGSYGWALGEAAPEEWRHIQSHPGFEVSDLGRIRKTETKELVYILRREWYTQSQIYREAFPELHE